MVLGYELIFNPFRILQGYGMNKARRLWTNQEKYEEKMKKKDDRKSRSPPRQGKQQCWLASKIKRDISTATQFLATLEAEALRGIRFDKINRCRKAGSWRPRCTCGKSSDNCELYQPTSIRKTQLLQAIKGMEMHGINYLFLSFSLPFRGYSLGFFFFLKAN